LVETQLAAEMGVSRSPIREALRELSQDGLVIALPNSATTVAPIDEADIAQIFEMRDLLESCLVAHAAKLRTDTEILECEALLDTMPAIVKAVDIPRYAENDARFHSLLWHMAKRPRISEALVPLANHGRRYLNLTSKWLQSESGATLLASHAEHIEVLEAIKQRDASRATDAIRTHMESSRARIMRGFWSAKEGALTQTTVK
jgi:DNA-binding GntR family transcriptional regulator